MSRQMTHLSVFRPDSGREVLITLHTRHAPSASEWQSWVDVLRARGDAVKGDLARLANIVITDGGAPSTEQRTEINNLIAQGHSFPNVALVTDSTLVRRVARGLAIFNPQFKVFAPAEFARALMFVGLDASQRTAVLAECERKANAELGAGAVRTIEAIRGKL